MRLIKFRAWDTGWKRMIQWDDVKFDNNLASLQYSTGYVYEQFTGLHDKNGREIYEGDILEVLEGRRGVVTYCDGAFELSESEDHGYICRLCSRLPESFTKIGNIHENGDLLK